MNYKTMDLTDKTYCRLQKKTKCLILIYFVNQFTIHRKVYSLKTMKLISNTEFIDLPLSLEETKKGMRIGGDKYKEVPYSLFNAL